VRRARKFLAESFSSRIVVRPSCATGPGPAEHPISCCTIAPTRCYSRVDKAQQHKTCTSRASRCGQGGLRSPAYDARDVCSPPGAVQIKRGSDQHHSPRHRIRAPGIVSPGIVSLWLCDRADVRSTPERCVPTRCHSYSRVTRDPLYRYLAYSGIVRRHLRERRMLDHRVHHISIAPVRTVSCHYCG
jgi:hypothetical protein